MYDIKKRIEDRLAEIGKSARRASFEGGLHRDAIRNILRAKSKNPRRDTLEGIARGLNWTMEELLDLPGQPNVSNFDKPIFDVPLISWVTAGELRETSDPYEAGDAEQHIPVSHKRNTLIALRVHGNSMNRVAPEDTLIIVDYADKYLISGRYYVVKLDVKATFKRYRGDPNRLEPDSTEDFDTFFVDKELEVVGRVIQTINRLD